MQNRDFKGVWIPKEIWLNKDLTLLEMVIFVEIDSLDNEDNCVAGNEYFADFCGCSESKVSKAIKKLQELNMIEIISFDGRHRKMRVVKNAMQSSKKCYADSQKMLPNNIINKPINNKTISKDIVEDTKYSEPKTKKKNLYQKCMDMIDEYTTNVVLREKLKECFKLFTENNREVGKPLYANQFKGKLNMLSDLATDSATQIKIVEQTLKLGYNGFYELKEDKPRKRTGNVAHDIEHLYNGVNEKADKRCSDGEKF